MATRDATWAYRDRFHESFGRTYFRRFSDGLVSSIGLGTYLGDATDAAEIRPVGPLGLVRSLWNADVRVGLGYLVAIARNLGRRLRA